jgi:Obg family GTPase CgtA-like protein
VPGLIEGASTGAGLGHAFLRHVERTRILVHIVDGSDRDPEWSYNVIRDELEAHDPALLEKPMLVAFNKMDQAGRPSGGRPSEAARKPKASQPWPSPRPRGKGIQELRLRLAELLPNAAELSEAPHSDGVVVHHIESVGDSFRVDIEDGIYVVRGKKIELLAAQTNFDVEESAERFQRELARLGIEDELRRQGVVPGHDGPHRQERARMGARRLGRPVTDWIAPEDRRVGILGGTFDPIHYGHLAIAEQVREALRLDRVLFVPAARPPHKLDEPMTPAEDRAAMVRLAITGNPAFAVCRIEMERSGPSYTVDTLEELADEARRSGIKREFFFILSSEAAAALPTWRSPARSSNSPSWPWWRGPGSRFPTGRRPERPRRRIRGPHPGDRHYARC